MIASGEEGLLFFRAVGEAFHWIEWMEFFGEGWQWFGESKRFDLG